MKIYNIWETSFANRFEYLTNLKDFFSMIDPNDYRFISIKDKYIPSTNPDNLLESCFQNQNIGINYTDEDHPILYEKDPFRFEKNYIISSQVYEKNKEYIINQMRKMVLVSLYNNPLYVTLHGYYLTDELLDLAISICKQTIFIKNASLTPEQIQKLKNSFINVFLENNGEKVQLSRFNIFSRYSKMDLEDKKELYVSYEISSEDYPNMIFIRDNATLDILTPKFSDFTDKEKEAYYSNIRKLLEYYNKLNKKFKICFNIDKRSDLLKYIPDFEKYEGKNIVMQVEYISYNMDEFIKENKILESLISNIKNSTMSNLEKYLAVYNIVKRYKPYNESIGNLNYSRQIKYLVDNEYMVCAGYSALLIELLQRVGIEASEYSTVVYKIEDDEHKFRGAHSRTTVNLIDDKYHINGYYIADATWDNHQSIGDTYRFALRPFDSMQNSKDIFSLNKIDYILDNHSFEEFVEKVNILLAKLMENDINEVLSKEENLLQSYSIIFDKIIEFLKTTDIKKYHELKEYTHKSIKERDEEFYIRFLTDIGHYIVGKSNKEIDISIIARAASIAKYYNEDVPDALREAYADFVINDYNKFTKDRFFKWEDANPNKNL